MYSMVALCVNAITVGHYHVLIYIISRGNI